MDNFNPQVVEKESGNDDNPFAPIDPPKREDIPNIRSLRDTVFEILHFINTPDMVTLKSASKAEFEQCVETKFPHFSERYFSAFKKLVSGTMTPEELEMYLNMLDGLERFKNGETSFESINDGILDSINKKFLPEDLYQQNEVAKKVMKEMQK